MRRARQIVKEIITDLRHRDVWLSVAALAFGTIVFQVCFPADMTFVGATLDGKPVAFMKRSQLESLIRQRYTQANLSAKDIGVRTSFRDAGIEANVITTANNVFDYPILHRFLPFSGVYYAFHNQHKTVPVYNVN